MKVRIEHRHLYVALMLYALYALLTMYILMNSEANPVNTYLFFTVFNNKVQALTPLLTVISIDDYGRALFWIPIALILWYFGGRYRRASVLMVSAFVISLLLGELMKHIIYEPRPFLVLHITPLIHEQLDSSYPSGHALIVGTGGAYSAIIALPWYVSLPLTLEALLVSYGRIYVGVHWPLDVIAGWLLGIANVELVLALPQYYGGVIYMIMKKLLGWLSRRSNGSPTNY
ncbi:phosphatase PAP2 family protein [Vulcanisaeta souniana]|uniref:undecaprenyl-diphosphatase SepP n=1 Tax=Vulcanisaeta souniana TaxID=164452 RepID=UPI0006D14647|nr:phosphatase PAP2 family protein [Vulcanisaeta souniana]